MAEEKRSTLKRAGKAVCFILFGILLAAMIQPVFVPKMNIPRGPLRGFYGLEENTADILFLGSSRVQNGIDPMKLYCDTQITSYNLGSPVQVMPVSCFLLKEALKSQSPSVVIIESGELLWDGQAELSVKYVMDAMPLSNNKVEFAKWYDKVNEQDKSGSNFLGSIFPLFAYHGRWNELSSVDFSRVYASKDFTKGQYVLSHTVPLDTTIQIMNANAEALQDDDAVVIEYPDSGREETRYQHIRYDISIPQLSLEWLKKIQQLCEDNGCRLLVVGIPAILYPQDFNRASTFVRYEMLSHVLNEMGIPFIDTLYDLNAGFDLNTDFVDGGHHLNELGAQKLMDALEPILRDMMPEKELYPRESYEECVAYYKKAIEAVNLESEGSFSDYITFLRDNREKYIILMAAADDMRNGLSGEDMALLASLGLSCDFENDMKSRDSFLCVIDSGNVRHEAVSNRKIEWSYAAESGKRFYVSSAGWFNGSAASITVDGAQYALSSRGLNIVVFDKESGMVIDSVTFDTCAEVHACTRNANLIESLFYAYIAELGM